MSRSLDKAYQAIKTAVLEGDFQSGERLVEQKLVELSGTSRTPVREAIKQLVAENYLVQKPNIGVSVASWSDAELEDIFRLRAKTEGMIASRATENISQEQIERLEQHVVAIDDVLANPPFDIPRFLQENAAFHQTIIEAAESPVLAQTLARVTSPPIVYQVAHNFTAAELKRSNSHHREILDSMRVRDGEWANHCMQSHILSAFNRMRALRGERS